MDKALKKHEYDKPYYMCEFAHAMNNSMGGLQEYMDAFDKNPGSMGGAIWEWQDQAIWNRRDPAHPFLAYGGGFGDKPNDSVFILKGGGVFTDRTRNPKYFEVKHGYQWIKTAARDLARGELTVREQIRLHPVEPVFSRRGASPVTGRKSRTATCRCRKSRRVPARPLDVPLPPGLLDACRANISCTSATVSRKSPPGPRRTRKPEIATDQFALLAQAVVGRGCRGRPGPAPGASPLQVASDEARITVSGQSGGSPFHAVFDRTNGALSELVYGETPMIVPGTGGLALYAFRAPHRKDDSLGRKGLDIAGLDHLKMHPSEVKVVSANDGNGGEVHADKASWKCRSAARRREAAASASRRSSITR